MWLSCSTFKCNCCGQIHTNEPHPEENEPELDLNELGVKTPLIPLYNTYKHYYVYTLYCYIISSLHKH